MGMQNKIFIREESSLKIFFGFSTLTVLRLQFAQLLKRSPGKLAEGFSTDRLGTETFKLLEESSHAFGRPVEEALKALLNLD